MSNTIKQAFLGFKQVTLGSFEQITDRAGYLWFVRDVENGITDIWFGNRKYASFDPSMSGDLSAVKSAVEGILSDIGYTEDGALAFSDALQGETTLTGAVNKLAQLINDKDVTYYGEDAIVVDAESHVVSLAINADDKVLSQDENGLLANISLTLDKEADEEGKRYIKLLGKANADLGKIDIAEFVKDSMISGAKLEVEGDVTYLVLSFNEDVEDVKLNVTELIDVYLAGDGLTLSGKTFSVSLVESDAKENYLVLEDGSLGVFEMGADVTKTTEEILIAGGPLATQAKSVFGESIPSGKTVQDILVALFCKEEWPTSLSSSKAGLASTVGKPTFTISTSDVEVGTSVEYTVKNGASSTSATAAQAKTFTYGYSTSNNNTKEFSGTTVSAAVTNIALVNSATTLTVTTANGTQTADGTNVAGSAEITGTIVAASGTNSLSASNTSATYSGQCAGLPEYWGCSNLKKTSDSYKTNAVSAQTFAETTSVSNSASTSFQGKYKYFIGYYGDSTFADKVYTSKSVREDDMKQSGFMNGTTISTIITVPAGTKGMYIAIPEGVDNTGSTLEVIQTTALNSPVQDEMKNNLRTFENMACAGSATKNYKIFTWSFPGGTSGSETFAINKF
jgi:hypothetical protein